jgi:DNA-binding transcriptional ArsR family regulator
MTKLATQLEIFDEQRLIILKKLLKCPGQCGCDLTEALKMAKNLLSYHLEILIRHGLVQQTKCGRKKYYCIPAAQRQKVKQILKIVSSI